MTANVILQSQAPALTRMIFAGHVNVAPRHLTAEAETLLSATLIHEVGWFSYMNEIGNIEILCSIVYHI